MNSARKEGGGGGREGGGGGGGYLDTDGVSVNNGDVIRGIANKTNQEKSNSENISLPIDPRSALGVD